MRDARLFFALWAAAILGSLTGHGVTVGGVHYGLTGCDTTHGLKVDK